MNSLRHFLFAAAPAACVLALAACSAAPVEPVKKSVPPPSTESLATRDARMGWWRDARFGMFIHWGLYSGLEGEYEGKPIFAKNVEWFQYRAGLSTDAYAKIAFPKFKPAPGRFTKAWAKLAKDAGCKYVVMTTKHHEGFDLFESKLSNYTAKALLDRDFVREYVDAVRAEGLRVGFYHSVIDWHHADYDFRFIKGLPYPKNAEQLYGAAPRDHSKYIKFLHGQVVDELMSNYGKVDVMWFDFSSAESEGDEAWGATKLMGDVREKQPGIILNNRLYGRPESGISAGPDGRPLGMDVRYGDFDTPEQEIPATGVPGTDWETCMTINKTWGYSRYDTNWKSLRVLLRNLGDIASKGGNFLLNIGPRADGTIPPETIERMEGIGRWMKVNGEAIYGTTASPFAQKFDWGRVTHKGDTLYLLVFDRPADGRITLPLANASGAARFLAGGDGPRVAKTAAGLVIALPEKLADADSTVIELKLDGVPVLLAK